MLKGIEAAILQVTEAERRRYPHTRQQQSSALAAMKQDNQPASDYTIKSV